MGAATARVLAGAGAKAVLWDMNLSAAEAVAEEIGGTAIQCDVTSEASVKAALAQSGDPRILVNCAGILIGRRIVGRDGPADLDHFIKVINVNLTGTYNTMRLVAGEMSKLDPLDGAGERGVIVKAASIAHSRGRSGRWLTARPRAASSP